MSNFGFGCQDEVRSKKEDFVEEILDEIESEGAPFMERLLEELSKKYPQEITHALRILHYRNVLDLKKVAEV